MKQKSTYETAMELPANTQNTVIFNLLRESVTDKDVKYGTDRDCFAYAHLIEWAVRNKKFVEYYSHMKQFTDEKGREQEHTRLHDNKEVIVRFNVAGDPFFGFYQEEDGEPAQLFPSRDGRRVSFL
jgi:hypothetical protein